MVELFVYWMKIIIITFLKKIVFTGKDIKVVDLHLTE